MARLFVVPRGLCAPFAMWAALLSGEALAEPMFSRLYQQQFGYAPSCNACHRDGGGTPVNAYGEQFQQAGMNLAAFAAIADLDADGDGHRNGAEALARANPGSARSTPDKPGDWLDIASLIPREVQAAFPNVRAWLPRDAVLTAADRERAAALGATLDVDEAATIYIPLVERRPAGTALIFPATHGDKTVFLLLTTDRQLVVTGVSVLNGRQLPEAENHPVYARFKGLALDQLPVAEGSDLAAALTRAVKNAGTLIYVRLKSA